MPYKYATYAYIMQDVVKKANKISKKSKILSIQLDTFTVGGKDHIFKDVTLAVIFFREKNSSEESNEKNFEERSSFEKRSEVIIAKYGAIFNYHAEIYAKIKKGNDVKSYTRLISVNIDSWGDGSRFLNLERTEVFFIYEKVI